MKIRTDFANWRSFSPTDCLKILVVALVGFVVLSFALFILSALLKVISWIISNVVVFLVILALAGVAVWWVAVKVADIKK